MAEPFHEVRERLLRAGGTPRHVRRYLTELADHLADLRAEEELPISLPVFTCGLVGGFFCREPIRLSAAQQAQCTGSRIFIFRPASYTISARRFSSVGESVSSPPVKD